MVLGDALDEQQVVEPDGALQPDGGVNHDLLLGYWCDRSSRRPMGSKTDMSQSHIYCCLGGDRSYMVGRGWSASSRLGMSI